MLVNMPLLAVTLPVALNVVATTVVTETLDMVILPPVILPAVDMLPPVILPVTLNEVNVPTEVILAWLGAVTYPAVSANALTLAKLTSSWLNGILPVSLAKVYGTVDIFYPKIFLFGNTRYLSNASVSEYISTGASNLILVPSNVVGLPL